jgi:hypothetical protein
MRRRRRGEWDGLIGWRVFTTDFRPRRAYPWWTADDLELRVQGLLHGQRPGQASFAAVGIAKQSQW